MKALNNTSLSKFLKFSPVILLVSLIIYSFKTHENKNQLENEFFKEKKILEKELDKIVADYKEIRTKKKWLTKRVITGMNKIIALKDSVKKMEKVNYDLLFKYSLKVTKLERENRKLFLKAESLDRENKRLRKENNDVKNQLEAGEKSYNSLLSKNKKLTAEERELKRKVSIAGNIKISGIQVQALKERNNGKYTSTSRSRKTDAFKIKFDMLPNQVASMGKKQVYVQLLDKNEEVIPSERSDANKEIAYNDLINVNYDKEKIGVVSLISVDRTQLTKGKYTVNVFIDKRKVGETSISLR
ncbi:hypothetical protein [uncultured Tenacibaculum sp.]|uniref:hypothetical protein n=1 Tax=uncultured Tenacibaculum sp. TaxID=174713 RepID=UPI0026090D7B|nr:hypothetical protein [uncultured Tenacibaculum sp.]